MLSSSISSMLNASNYDEQLWRQQQQKMKSSSSTSTSSYYLLPRVHHPHPAFASQSTAVSTSAHLIPHQECSMILPLVCIPHPHCTATTWCPPPEDWGGWGSSSTKCLIPHPHVDQHSPFTFTTFCSPTSWAAEWCQKDENKNNAEDCVIVEQNGWPSTMTYDLTMLEHAGGAASVGDNQAWWGARSISRIRIVAGCWGLSWFQCELLHLFLQQMLQMLAGGFLDENQQQQSQDEQEQMGILFCLVSITST